MWALAADVRWVHTRAIVELQSRIFDVLDLDVARTDIRYCLVSWHGFPFIARKQNSSPTGVLPTACRRMSITSSRPRPPWASHMPPRLLQTVRLHYPNGRDTPGHMVNDPDHHVDLRYPDGEGDHRAQLIPPVLTLRRRPTSRRASVAGAHARRSRLRTREALRRPHQPSGRARRDGSRRGGGTCCECGTSPYPR